MKTVKCPKCSMRMRRVYIRTIEPGKRPNTTRMNWTPIGWQCFNPNCMHMIDDDDIKEKLKRGVRG